VSYKKSVITRNHIIDTVIDHIYEKGIDKISLNKILEAAQVSKGSFYHEFNSLDGLMHGVFRKTALIFWAIFFYLVQK
jgi:AcrR family transcriptional regulator